MAIKLLKPHTHRGRTYPASTDERPVILTGLRPDQEQWLAAIGVGEVTPAPAAEAAPAPTPAARASKRAGA